MLNRLFGSNTRVKLIKLYLGDPDKEYFVRELTRVIDEQINSVRRELDNLKKIGLLRSRVRNRKKYYSVNQSFLLFDELKNIVVKTASSYGDIAAELDKTGKLELLLVSGIFIDASSALVDLLIIGVLDKDRLNELISTLERRVGHELRYALMTKEDYLFRRNCQDRFIKSLLNGRYVVAIDRLNFDFKQSSSS